MCCRKWCVMDSIHMCTVRYCCRSCPRSPRVAPTWSDYHRRLLIVHSRSKQWIC